MSCLIRSLHEPRVRRQGMPKSHADLAPYDANATENHKANLQPLCLVRSKSWSRSFVDPRYAAGDLRHQDPRHRQHGLPHRQYHLARCVLCYPAKPPAGAWHLSMCGWRWTWISLHLWCHAAACGPGSCNERTPWPHGKPPSCPRA